jgi:hypothetical protein
MDKRPVWPKVVGAAVGIIVCAIALLGMARPDRAFSFVTEDHPVDTWADGGDKWAYFSEGGTVPALLPKARRELLGLGYVEDTTQRPWYRFVHGSKEVVICNHHEFEVNGTGLGSSKLAKPRPRTGSLPPNPWVCVLVKNGPGTSMNLTAFEIHKLIRGW